MKRTILFAVAAFSLGTPLASAWDDSGHLLVDEIAARKLHPAVVKKIEALLPLLETRFNGHHPYNLATAGLWMDDMRRMGKSYPWSRWHYIDAPVQGGAFTEPPPPHALWALEQAIAVLRKADAEPRAHAEAVAQIMHLVADLHQPMHAATRDDQGGNAVHLAPLIRAEPGPSNLHAFWDAACRYDAVNGSIVQVWERLPRFDRPKAPGEPGAIAEKAVELLAQSPRTPVPALAQCPWKTWARETHALACRSGWPAASSTGETSVKLTPAFVHEAHEIALQQTLKAGERLAALLNEVLSEQ